MDLLSVLFPPCCGGCGTPGTALCPGCWRRLRPAPPAIPPANIERCRSLFVYAGVGRDLLVRLKYANQRAIVGWLASGMAALVREAVAGSTGAVVCWAPTTAERRRTRGFDQAELLARAVAGELAVPCRPLLTRWSGPAQTGLSREERRGGPGFGASLRGGTPALVVLVDDVITTGATVAAAAGALRAAGVPRVVVVTAAATALKVRSPSVDR